MRTVSYISTCVMITFFSVRILAAELDFVADPTGIAAPSVEKTNKAARDHATWTKFKADVENRVPGIAYVYEDPDAIKDYATAAALVKRIRGKSNAEYQANLAAYEASIKETNTAVHAYEDARRTVRKAEFDYYMAVAVYVSVQLNVAYFLGWLIRELIYY